jgi:hypothetical protein
MPATERDPDHQPEAQEAPKPTRRERRAKATVQRGARDDGKAHGSQATPSVRRYAFRRS